MRRLFAIAILVLLSFNTNAQNVQEIEQSINKLKDKISALEVKNQQEMIENRYFDPSHIDDKMLRLQEKLADKHHDLAKIQGRIIDLSEIRNEKNSTSSFSTLASSITPQTGDIIVFKPKEDFAAWWAFAGHGWQHAAIFYSSNELVQALSPGKNSVKMTWNDFISNVPFDKMDRVVLIKMNLTSSEKANMKFYQDTFQVGVPYPSKWAIPFTKYSIDTFYCSSLVWAAHKWSAKKIDLDYVASPALVWPVDLLNSTNYSQHYYVSW